MRAPRFSAGRWLEGYKVAAVRVGVSLKFLSMPNWQNSIFPDRWIGALPRSTFAAFYPRILDQYSRGRGALARHQLPYLFAHKYSPIEISVRARSQFVAHLLWVLKTPALRSRQCLRRFSHLAMFGGKTVDRFAGVHRFSKHAETVLRADYEIAVVKRLVHNSLRVVGPPNRAFQSDSIPTQHRL